LLGNELTRHFRHKGWDISLAATQSEARRMLHDERLDPLVVLADMSLPDGNSLDLLDWVRKAGLPGEWIFLTGYGSVPDSVRALRLGAFDFLEKPCNLDRLEVVIGGAARSARAQQQLRFQAEAGSRRYSPDSIIGGSPATRELRDLIVRLVEVPFSALVIGGETGTGKGLVARILHHSGPRRAGPLVEVNCAALPRDLLESELFGHEAGAFTGAKGRHRGYMEQAHGGTLFLDEIAEMDLDLQSKLLKAIEDRTLRRLGGEREIPIDVQILAASARNLEQRVREGRFRSDLFHRLSVFQLDIPPLRDRLDDLDDLVPLIVAEFNAKAGKEVKAVPEAVYRRLRAYTWPGNVRELRNVIERGVLLAEGDSFPEEWLQLGQRVGTDSQGPQVEGNRVSIPLDGSMALDQMDSYIIETALERHGRNVTATARALGTTRETLRYRIQKYGLRPPDARTDDDAARGPGEDGEASRAS
jgi:DNA-binding NtrC family response regulator